MVTGLSTALTTALKDKDQIFKALGQANTELVSEMKKAKFPIAKIKGIEVPVMPTGPDSSIQEKIMKATKLVQESVDKVNIPFDKSITGMFEKGTDGLYGLNTDDMENFMQTNFGDKLKSILPNVNDSVGSLIGGNTSLATDALNKAQDLVDFAALQAPASFSSLTEISSGISENFLRGSKGVFNILTPSKLKKIADKMSSLSPSGFLNMNLPDMPSLPGLGSLISSFKSDSLTANGAVGLLNKALGEAKFDTLKDTFDTFKTKLDALITNSDGEDPDDAFT